jgi:lipid-binding SYLF domain-containing protein
MIRLNGTYTALATAIALASSVASAQDDERLSNPALQDRPGVVGVDNAPGDPGVLEDDRIGNDIEDADELADAIEDQQELADRRSELHQSAEAAIEELRAADANAAQALDEAYGYAVFDTTKGGFIITGTGGTGVAQVKDGAQRTYMHVGGAGIGLGAGGENYKLVLVFPDEESYGDFTGGEWEGGASAQAAAGEEGAAAETLTDEVQVYRLTDVGLIAQADLTAMRFWPSDELNGEELEEDLAEIEDDAGRELR